MSDWFRLLAIEPQARLSRHSTAMRSLFNPLTPQTPRRPGAFQPINISVVSQSFDEITSAISIPQQEGVVVKQSLLCSDFGHTCPFRMIGPSVILGSFSAGAGCAGASRKAFSLCREPQRAAISAAVGLAPASAWAG